MRLKLCVKSRMKPENQPTNSVLLPIAAAGIRGATYFISSAMFSSDRGRKPMEVNKILRNRVGARAVAIGAIAAVAT